MSEHPAQQTIKIWDVIIKTANLFAAQTVLLMFRGNMTRVMISPKTQNLEKRDIINEKRVIIINRHVTCPTTKHENMDRGMAINSFQKQKQSG